MKNAEFAVKDLPLGRALQLIVKIIIDLLVVEILFFKLIHHHESVLPKGRSFTASAGT